MRYSHRIIFFLFFLKAITNSSNQVTEISACIWEGETFSLDFYWSIWSYPYGCPHWLLLCITHSESIILENLPGYWNTSSHKHLATRTLWLLLFFRILLCFCMISPAILTSLWIISGKMAHLCDWDVECHKQKLERLKNWHWGCGLV